MAIDGETDRTGGCEGLRLFFEQAFGRIDAGELVGQCGVGKDGRLKATGGKFDPSQTDKTLCVSVHPSTMIGRSVGVPG